MKHGPSGDEELYRYVRKPEPVKPWGKTQKIQMKILSLVMASVIWYSIKQHLATERQWRIWNMQDVAAVQGEPLVIQDTKTTVGSQVKQILSGETPETNTQTTIINPPGVEPAIKVITEKETILADEHGKPIEIIPHDTINKTAEISNTVTLKDAEPVVNEALKDAAQRILPEKKDPLNPLPAK